MYYDEPGVDVTSEAPKKPITVEQLDALIALLFQKKEEAKELEKLVTAKNVEISKVRADITVALKELGREDYKAAAGSVKLKTIWRVSLPQSDEDKQKLFDWLKERGIFNKYATVNSNSLNSLYMAEWEDAKMRGEGMEFEIPGVPQPKSFQTLGEYASRKGKK